LFSMQRIPTSITLTNFSTIAGKMILS
jgi:hypothetical protein